MCRPDDGPHYLLVVAGRRSSAEVFCFEMLCWGGSVWVRAVPRDLVLGTTWIYLIHPHAIRREVSACESRLSPGVFCVFRPQRIELLVWESQYTEDLVEHYKGRGITAVPIPDGDPDHTPRGGRKT